MTAAFKMAAPSELCAQTKTLMIFCKTDAKSIKAMRQHVAVTEARMQALLADMLRHNLVWRQSNGMYKTCNNKLHLVEPTNAISDSMAALAEPADSSNKGLLTAEEASELASAHEELNINAHKVKSQFEAVGSELDANEEADNLPYRIAAAKERVALTAQNEAPEQAKEWPATVGFETNFTASEFAPKPYDLDAMANEFEAEQERGDQHVIDNLDAKQRVLNYCQMLLSPTSTEMRRCLDELQMDLAVIRLHQERSV